MISNRGRMLRIISSLVVLVAITLMPLAGISDSAVQAAEPPERQEAPVRLAPLEPLPPGTGFIPPPMDLSHLKGDRMPQGLRAGTPPSKWDWRQEGKVTSVKNQGGCGACYAFAAIANIESKLLIDDAGSYDLSENNAKECNWYHTSCSGGDYWQIASFFSQKGVVLESCDPYVPADVACNDTCPYQKTLLDWRIISGEVVPEVDVLKSYIQTYGPIYTSMYAGNNDDWANEFSHYDGSYTLHYSGTPQDPNHAVLIVGWDDSLTHAGGTGGWLIKNSWDTDWGGTCGYGTEKGYFTIAYGSANIGMYSSFMYGWQDYDASGGIMYYDEGGQTNAIGYGDSTTAWGLCKFIPSKDTYVTRVEFWTTDKTTDVDVFLYDNFDGTSWSNSLYSKLDNVFNEAGYHSVKLDTPLAVKCNDEVVAVVKFTNDSCKYPVPVDDVGPYEAELTYSSLDGSTWYDEGEYADDVAIRLRTSDIPVPDITVSPASFNVTQAPNTTQNYTLTIGNVGNATLTYDISDRTTGGEGVAAFEEQSSDSKIKKHLMESNASRQPMSFPSLSNVLGEIFYDDGVYEDGWYWDYSGGLFAVRFTPTSYPVNLKKARICLYPDWPDSDHEQFAVEVYDDNGVGGAPGTQLGTTVYSTATDWGWQDVNISGLGITITSGDFYIAYKQLTDAPNCEELCADYTSPDARSWLGDPEYGWWPVEEDEEADVLDWMIRCVVEVGAAKNLVSISASPPSISLPVGGTQQLSVIAHYSDGSTADVTHSPNCAFTSGNSAIATVSSPGGGIITGASPGSTTVHVSYTEGDITKTIDVPIVVTPPDDCHWMSENLPSGSVNSGGSTSITVTINPAGLAVGDYHGEIVIANNDSDENPTIVPVTLRVEWSPWVYDTSPADGYIEISELLHAISDYIGGRITISQLLQVISLYISHTNR